MMVTVAPRSSARDVSCDCAHSSSAEGADEDTWFFLKARRLGFTAYMDLDTPIGHLTTANVWPERDEKGQITARIITGVDERREVKTGN